MGLDVNGTQFILYAKTLGVDFTRTVMIGRQGLHLARSELERNLTRFGHSCDRATVDRMLADGYADEFLRYVGAEDVHSIDNSAYEDATHIVDLNEAIPVRFEQEYSVVCDGGSLEHVFNFPMALRNCMEMVRVGGHYLGITPANNFMGHGFYQFSPELFFSVFTPENGYELVRVIACEDDPDADWYAVSSPESVGGRITLTNSRPVYLLVIARRTAETAPLRSMPQQSDYAATWKAHEGEDASGEVGARMKSRLKELAIRHAPYRVRRMAERWLLRPGFNRRFFRPLSRTEGIDSSN